MQFDAISSGALSHTVPARRTRYRRAWLPDAPGCLPIEREPMTSNPRARAPTSPPTVSKYHAGKEGLVIYDADDVTLSVSDHDWDPTRRRRSRLYLGGLACLGVAGLVGWWLLCERGRCTRDGPDLSNGCDDASCPDGAGNSTRLLA